MQWIQWEMGAHFDSVADLFELLQPNVRRGKAGAELAVDHDGVEAQLERGAPVEGDEACVGVNFPRPVVVEEYTVHDAHVVPIKWKKLKDGCAPDAAICLCHGSIDGGTLHVSEIVDELLVDGLGVLVRELLASELVHNACRREMVHLPVRFPWFGRT